MADVLIRGIAEELRTWLRQEAEKNGRSVNAEVIEILEITRESRSRGARRLARVDAWRKKYLPENFEPLDAVALIRHDRDHGH